MILRRKADGGYRIECDNCFAHGVTHTEFRDALKATNLNGWSTYKTARGILEDLCPECTQKHKNTEGDNDNG